jgi:hypothetical protein
MVLLLLEVLESASKTSAIRKTFTRSSFLESLGVKTGHYSILDCRQRPFWWLIIDVCAVLNGAMG